jgi:spore maturation protein CgeB
MRMQGVELLAFAMDEELRAHGRVAMNAALLHACEEFDPDIALFILFTDEILPETVEAITRRGRTVTVNWFCDDHWRFRSFSRHWANRFLWVATTDSAAVEAYHAVGQTNVVKTQWGFNHYRRSEHPASYERDVAFVGMAHSVRRGVITRLWAQGVPVECWGRGWDGGRLTQEAMTEVFRRSRVNLNFAESSVASGPRRLAKIVLARRADDTWRLNRPAAMRDLAASLRVPQRPQIKGRAFEIPGHGGFLLTSAADNLAEYYVPGKEIAVFDGERDLEEQIRHYLAHDDERERIREGGEARTLRDHTYEQRLRALFSHIGNGRWS